MSRIKKTADEINAEIAVLKADAASLIAREKTLAARIMAEVKGMGEMLAVRLDALEIHEKGWAAVHPTLNFLLIFGAGLVAGAVLALVL